MQEFTHQQFRFCVCRFYLRHVVASCFLIKHISHNIKVAGPKKYFSYTRAYRAMSLSLRARPPVFQSLVTPGLTRGLSLIILMQ